MKKLHFYICLLIVPLQVSSQFDYSVDFISSIDYTYVNEEAIVSTLDYSLAPKINYRFGGNFNVKVYENIFIKSGIRFVQVGFVDKLDGIRWPSEIGANGYEPDPTLTKYIYNTIDQRQIEIPVIGRYETGEKKLSFFIEAGISPHIYLKTRSKKETNLTTETIFVDETDLGSKRLIMTFVLGAGVNYNLSEKFQIFLQPTMRFYTSAKSRYLGPRDFRSVGIEFGIRRGFSFVEKSKSE